MSLKSVQTRLPLRSSSLRVKTVDVPHQQRRLGSRLGSRAVLLSSHLNCYSERRRQQQAWPSVGHQPLLVRLPLPCWSVNNFELDMMSRRANRLVGLATETPAPPADVESPQLKVPMVPPPRNGPQPAPYAYMALFGVAMLWGSYAPAIKYIFLSDDPPSASVMNALQAVLSGMFLAGSCAAAAITQRAPDVHPEALNPLAAEAAASASAAAAIQGFSDDEDGRRTPASSFERLCASALNWKSSNVVVVGAELGLWMCLAFGLEVLGVQLISATKTAFLNQATVLITPFLVHLSGEHVKRHEWLACGLGLTGSLLVAADGLGQGSTVSIHGGAALEQENPMGYAYVLLSAVFFAMSTVRLSRYSSSYPSLTIASMSTLGLSFFSILWVLVSWQGRSSGYSDTMSSLWHIFRDPVSLSVILWVGLGPGALATYLQASGQKTVPPAQAQVIFATTPIFATGFAMLTLDASDEAMGMVAWSGAVLLLGASLLASTGGKTAEAADFED